MKIVNTFLKIVIGLVISFYLVMYAATPIQGATDLEPRQRTILENNIIIHSKVAEIIEARKAEELRYMSSIIFAEAGNQCEAGQQAVGIIVMNRVRYEDYFEDDIISVIYEDGQFTPVDNGMLDTALEMYDEGILPASCIEAAVYAIEGNTIVNYNDKEYDLQDYLFFSRYIKNRKLIIEDHQFK